MLLRDGLLYVGLSQMVGGWVPHRTVYTATLSIIDTQTDKLLKMITDKPVVSPCLPVRLTAIQSSWMKKDIYISCVGAFGMVKVIMPEYCVSRQERLSSTQRIARPITGADISGEEKLRDLSLPSGM